MITFGNIIIINIKNLDNGIIEVALFPDNFQIILLEIDVKLKAMSCCMWELNGAMQ